MTNDREISQLYDMHVLQEILKAVRGRFANINETSLMKFTAKP